MDFSPKTLAKSGFPPIFLFGLSKLLEKYGVFESITYIDIPFHFLGGFLIARGLDMITVHKLKTKWILGGVGLVGIPWEIYEVLIGIPGSGVTFNTMQDLCVDMMGGTAYSMVRRKSPTPQKVQKILSSTE